MDSVKPDFVYPGSKVYLLVTLMGVLGASMAVGQSRFEAVIVDSSSNSPLVGVTARVLGTSLQTSSGPDGKVAFAAVPDGWESISFSSVGYSGSTIRLHFPLSPEQATLVVKLRESEIPLEGITVTTTRTSYHLSDAPTRIEVKGEEEIGEMMIDHPSSITELFLESTGIQVLQTSAISGYVNIRLQGLDGSYTQILKDGFPLFGGLSAGLSVAQIPPLDLERVEIIKGPSSSLYGGGAIAGIINLISKKPDPAGTLVVLANAESDRGISAGAYYSRQFNDKAGLTLTVNGVSHSAYDADHSGFSDVPRNTEFIFNPKFTYSFGETTNLSIGISTAAEDMLGGDMAALADGVTAQHPYVERTNSHRTFSQLELSSTSGATVYTVKNSIGYFSLANSLAGLQLNGSQWMSYTEVALLTTSGPHSFSSGITLTTDRFSEQPSSANLDRSYKTETVGVFSQDDWRLSPSLVLETGLRLDKEGNRSVAVLPRVGGILRLSGELSLRANGGMGYKTPTVFSDQSDPYAIYSLLPVASNVEPEESVGGEFDFGYNTVVLGLLSLNVNQAFFYTRVENPFVYVPSNANPPGPGGLTTLQLTNANGYLVSRGAETDVKCAYGEIEAFLGYSYTDARSAYSSVSAPLPLTPHHKIVTDIVYDLEEFGKLGVEVRYTGPQTLQDGSTARDFWVLDVLLQKGLGRFTFFVGAEDLFNLQQHDFAPVVTGSIVQPHFSDVWAPIEGRVINVGLKLKL